MQKVRWGILGAAKIAREKVIPAMQLGQYSQVVALASRNQQHAEEVTARLNIPMAFGSYNELLASPDVDAVYIPLPNHLHVEWCIKAMQAGKHVLCEKPVALSGSQARVLMQVAEQHPNIKIMEAFMYRFHPQWLGATQMVSDGRIGTLKTIQSFFSYFNNDPGNIRNQVDAGGGGLMDIGCYCVSLSRFIFGAEPQRAIGIAERDPSTGTDRLTSAMLDFGRGTSTFSCSTQLTAYQRVNIFGTEGRIELEIPFNAPANAGVRSIVVTKDGTEEIVYEPVDQYTLQGDAFSAAILNNSAVPTPLIDAVNNMQVIEAIFQSADENAWVTL
ncbi:Gfo/Idh/MocA family oxidoreductase [Segetibacter sp. 3557_3]|uniref:Gfo/Idh/MocA family protein n=1 Tax=Segetibacter sp. 3557_3 TaxID=2547429 RepID=UPI0010584A47|nr:Gfo/Idh/MocA family oxidoreductase [Segetibacter sp. 3557_3]TDH25590.1 Gfo/Idh/MocA family oxidoreductase [Segetibacter sp. 3557_3]